MLILPLGLTGIAFSASAFLGKYQLWFILVGLVALIVAHYAARKGHNLVRGNQMTLLWVSTAASVISILYYAYSRYFVYLR